MGISKTRKKKKSETMLVDILVYILVYIRQKRKPTPHSIAPGSTAAAPFVIVQHPIWMVVDNDDVGGRGQRFAQCVKICLSTTREKTKTPSRVIFVVKCWQRQTSNITSFGHVRTNCWLSISPSNPSSIPNTHQSWGSSNAK